MFSNDREKAITMTAVGMSAKIAEERYILMVLDAWMNTCDKDQPMVAPRELPMDDRGQVIMILWNDMVDQTKNRCIAVKYNSKKEVLGEEDFGCHAESYLYELMKKGYDGYDNNRKIPPEGRQG
jgi:hypothetical protein